MNNTPELNQGSNQLNDSSASSPNNATSTPQAFTYQSFSSRQQEGNIKKSKKIIKIVTLVLVLLCFFVFIYFWLLPDIWAKTYERNVKHAYTQQAVKLKDVFDSFGKPTFTSDDITPEAAMQDLNYAQGTIDKANIATNELVNKNNLKVLPLMTLFGVGSTSTNHFSSMKTYISDSRVFLDNYTATVKYMKQLEKISTNDKAAFAKAYTDAITAKTQAQLLSNIKQGLPAIDKYLTDFKDLKPSTDFQKIHNDTLNIITEIQASFNNIISGFASHNNGSIVSGARQLLDASNSIDNISTLKINDILQKNSSLHKQIEKLKAEQPQFQK